MTENYPEFVPFPKIPRLHKECVVTEKIDGTNGIIYITDDGDMFIGSRNRWLSAESDGYNLPKGEKRFSLFNVSIWNYENKPECCYVVPTLYTGEFSTNELDDAMDKLWDYGSVASPGFMNPEGVMIFHSAANHYFKAPFDKNHKG